MKCSQHIDSTRSPHTRGRRQRYLYFSLIALFNVVIYFPSFFHGARADQIVYLAHMAKTHDWFSLITKSYSYDRVREFNPGDEILFRPVLFFVMATEKWLFGYNFMYWQIVSFYLHLTVIWWLLKLLMSIHESLFAPLLCLFFSVLFISMEMVIWHHLHGYEIFSALALAALYHFYLHLRERKTKVWRLWIITAYLLAAAFTYEAGGILSIAFALFLWLSYRAQDTRDAGPAQLKRWSAVILLLPCALYVILSASDFAFRETTALEGSDMWNKLAMGPTAENLVLAYGFWFYGGLVPLELDAYPWERIIMKPSDVFAWDDVHKMGRLLLSGGLGLAGIMAYALVLARGVSREFLKERSIMILLLVFILIAYSLLIVVGRLNTRGFVALTYNTYYSYIFWMLFIVLMYILVNFNVQDRTYYAKLKVIALSTLIALIYFNGYLVNQMNWEMVALSKPRISIIKYMQTLIHQSSGNNTTYMGCQAFYPANPLLIWLKKSGDPPDKMYTLLEALYPEYCQK